MFALLNIWLGSKLPSYFDFFAKSCSFNKGWNWFLFTDCVGSVMKYNESITLIPYTWKDLYKDCYFLDNINYKVDTRWNQSKEQLSNLIMWPKKGWPCRLYLAKKYNKILENYNFIGTFDCDVIYGDLNSRMPKNISDYGVVTGHSGALHPTNKNPRVCFPFTIFNSNCFDDIFSYVENREFILDSNYEFSSYFFNKHKVFFGNNIQPIGETIGFHDKRTTTWKEGRLFINNIEGGFYHFIKEKNNKNFKWNLDCLKYNNWIIDKNKIKKFTPLIYL
jgi:hypothetical protein